MPKWIVVALAAALAAGCSKKPQYSAEYLAECEGAPVGSAEKRQKAMEDGVYNSRFDCVQKNAAEKAQAKYQQDLAEAKALRDAQAAREPAKAEAKPAFPPYVFRILEINTATETELAAFPTLDFPGAKEIVAERAKGPFKDWQDVIRRTSALSQAQSVAYSSVMGLVVNGKSFDGAPPDERVALAYVKRIRGQ